MRITTHSRTIFTLSKAFFPLQLLFAVVKYNLIAVILWLVLFGVISGKIGATFGLPLLFYSPEYLGHVTWLSFFLLGFSVGGFIMGFNTYSYVKTGGHFPFLVNVNRPFFRFCINNALLPLSFIILYLYKMIQFQINEELQNTLSVILFAIGFLSGIAFFLYLSFLFFFRISKKRTPSHLANPEPIELFAHKRERWYETYKHQKKRSSIYIGKRMKLYQSRTTDHLDASVIKNVYVKNRINAGIYEGLTLTMFFGLGLFSDYEAFEVPASMSLTLLITIFLLIFSALSSWLKAWTIPVILILILVANGISKSTNLFHFSSYAYGLNYDKENRPEYSTQRIKSISNNEILNIATYNNYIESLENWKAQTGEEKPKLIIVNTSGGGLRNGLWTFTVLQHIESVLGPDVFKHTQLISGASGGMIGAAYYRELVLRRINGEITSSASPIYREKLSKDLLNQMSFMASTNDIFIRYKSVEYNDMHYPIDRGYGFENQLSENTDGFLDHTMGYYEPYESNGTIPTMIFAPTIVNDGRRLFISSQPLNFLASGAFTSSNQMNSFENIDIHSLLDNQNIADVKFTSVLRANATFPFVMPMITIPTTPSIELMDAGIRDNYGGKTTMLFLNAMEDWLKENTSGVIVVQLRDIARVFDDEQYHQVSFIDKLTLPFSNMYKNFPRIQNYNQDELIRMGTRDCEFPIDVISFNLLENSSDYVSLSLHLTKSEKNYIYNAVDSPGNKASLVRLKELLE